MVNEEITEPSVPRTKSGRRILDAEAGSAVVDAGFDLMTASLNRLAVSLQDDAVPEVNWHDEDDTMVHHVAELRRVAAV